jgi:hypothetical protein
MDTTNFGQGNDPPGRQSPSAADLAHMPSDFARATRTPLARPIFTSRSSALKRLDHSAQFARHFFSHAQALGAHLGQAFHRILPKAFRLGGNEFPIFCLRRAAGRSGGMYDWLLVRKIFIMIEFAELRSD